MAERAETFNAPMNPVPLLPPRPVPPRPTDLLPRNSTAAETDEAKGPETLRTERRHLLVGHGVSLSGEITACERLVVEGNVEANLRECRDIEIAESGLFKGAATIDHAEVRGRFEGELTVRKRLLIRATGHVAGKITYAEIEIEHGGRISGDIALYGAEEITEHRRARRAAGAD